MADRAQGSVIEGKGENNFDDRTISALFIIADIHTEWTMI